MDALTAAQIFLSVFLLYEIYSKKSMPVIAKFYELFSISMESTLSQTGTKRKRGIADGYKKFAWFSQAR